MGRKLTGWVHPTEFYRVIPSVFVVSSSSMERTAGQARSSDLFFGVGLTRFRVYSCLVEHVSFIVKRAGVAGVEK